MTRVACLQWGSFRLTKLLVALLALIAGFVSASTVVGAETAVAANNIESAAAVEADANIPAGHVGSERAVFDDWSSGCCVAPNTPGDGFLYRGVHYEHPDMPNAVHGGAKPWGGHADAARHNGGNNRSEFTSWTRNPEVAFDWASDGNGPGVVLRIPDADPPGASRVPSPDIYSEGEVLIQGPVTGADVTGSWDFGNLWGFND